MQADLLLKGGHLIDPRNNLDSAMDVAISGGVVAAVDADLSSVQAAQTIDITGLYVTPGLIDIHVHLYYTPANPRAWAGDYSIQPDGFSFRGGVTTMVDTGSSGQRNFEDFRRRVLDRSRTRTLAFINIAGRGMADLTTEQNAHDLLPQPAADMARENADVCVGIKIAHYVGPEWTSLERGLQAGRLADMPLMVDFGYFRPERPYYQMIGEELRPGDISTHMFRGPVPCIGPDGRVLPYLWEARERGVIFDCGHGAGSFVFGQAVPCVEQGFYPDSISTDLHYMSMNVGMLDMPTTMSKFLVMGMPLGDVIRASTVRPAEIIGHPELGHLSVGAPADVAILNLMKGSYGYLDSFDGRLWGEERLSCELTLKDGVVEWDWNGRSGVDYRQMGDRVGIRPGEERTMPV